MAQPWFRMWREVLHEPKLLCRPRWETFHWIVLLCLADDNGILRIEPEDIASVMHMPDIGVEEVRSALAYLEGRGMIRHGARDGDNPATIAITSWSRRQPKDHTAAERQQRKRDRDASRGVTDGHDSSRREKEREIERKIARAGARGAPAAPSSPSGEENSPQFRKEALRASKRAEKQLSETKKLVEELKNAGPKTSEEREKLKNLVHGLAEKLS